MKRMTKGAPPLLLLAAAMLAGCQSAPPAPTVAPVAEARPIRFDTRLLQDCAPLPVLKDSSDRAVMDFVREMLARYADCARAKKALDTEVRRMLAPPPAAASAPG